MLLTGYFTCYEALTHWPTSMKISLSASLVYFSHFGIADYIYVMVGACQPKHGILLLIQRMKSHKLKRCTCIWLFHTIVTVAVRRSWRTESIIILKKYHTLLAPYLWPDFPAVQTYLKEEWKVSAKKEIWIKHHVKNNTFAK